MKISWGMIDSLTAKLAEDIAKSDLEIRSLCGLPRGGLIPAVMLSHRLSLPLVYKPDKNSLIVDDISDSGMTLLTIQQPKATIFIRKGTLVVPQFYGMLIEHKEWIEFPWE